MSTSSDIRLEIAAPHGRGRPVVDWVSRYWQWLPVLPAALYLVGFFANLGSLLRSLYSVADWTSLLYIGQVLPSLPHTAHVVMWDFYLLEILGFEVVTRHLPGYHTLWEIVPWIAGALVAGAYGAYGPYGYGYGPRYYGYYRPRYAYYGPGYYRPRYYYGW